MTEPPLVKRDIDWGLFFFGCYAMSRGIVYTVPHVKFERLPLALEQLPSWLFVVYASLWWISGLGAVAAALMLRTHHRWAKIGVFSMCTVWAIVYFYSWIEFKDAGSLSTGFIYLFVGLACLMGRGTIQHWIRVGDAQ